MIYRMLFRIGLWLLRANLKVLRLQKGDVVAVRSFCHRDIMEQLQYWAERDTTFLPGVLFVGVHPEDGMERLSDADLKRAGLVRRPRLDYSKHWTEQLGRNENR